METKTGQGSEPDENNSLGKGLSATGQSPLGHQTQNMDVEIDDLITKSSSMQGEESSNRRILDAWDKIQTAEITEQELLDKIYGKLEAMYKVTAPAKNLHKVVQNGMESVMFVWKRLESARESINKTKLTLGMMLGSGPPKPRPPRKNETDRTPLKRKNSSPKQSEEPIKKRKEERSTTIQGQGTEMATTSSPQPSQVMLGKEQPWQTVETKKVKKKKEQKEGKGGAGALSQKGTRNKKPPRARPTRPDAFIIKATEGGSYADILRKMKTDPKLDEIGSSVSRVRKTAAGELLLELQRTAKGKTAEFQKEMEQALGQRATIRSLQDEVIFEIKDLDEITSKEDIVAALRRDVQTSDTAKVEEKAIKSVRKAYGGTQIATIQLPAAMALQMIQRQKIKIGWVVCRIREIQRGTRPIRCYKCLGFGHIATKCTAAQDRSECCYKCGGKGHSARDCDREAKCVLCHERDPTSKSDHAAGSYTCPAYIAAVEELKKRRR